MTEVACNHGPGIEKYCLNVEDEEEDGEDIISRLELNHGSAAGGDTTFVRLGFLDRIRFRRDQLRYEQGGKHEAYARESGGNRQGSIANRQQKVHIIFLMLVS